MNTDKKAAYETLHNCLNVVAQLISPVAPFFSDWIYKNLTDCIRVKAVQHKTPLYPESIHLTAFTQAEDSAIDIELEERMRLAQEISSMVLSLRKKVNLKVRQPLSRILIPSDDKRIQNQILLVKELILSEVNVKEIEFISDTSGLVKKKVKANYKLLGQKLGKKMKAAGEHIASLKQSEISQLERKGRIDLILESERFEILLEEVEVISEDIPGWLVANAGGLTVALDVNLTSDLKQEGHARELVSQIQKLRKELNFDVIDRISIIIDNVPGLTPSFNQFKTYICAEILADHFEIADAVSDGITILVNELPVNVVIKQIKSEVL